MPEVGSDAEPLAGKEIKSAEIDSHFDRALSMGDRWLSGLDQSSVNLTWTVSAGYVHIDGTLIIFADPVSEALTPSTTNYVFATKTRDITVNTTGTPPADSVLLYTVAAGASAVTSFTDNRDDTIVFEVPVKAPGFDADGVEIINVPTPVTATGAANRQFVLDSQAPTGQAPPLRAVSLTNLTLSGAQTVDGVALIAGDRVGAFGQTTAADRGPYIVAAGAWTRAPETLKGGLTWIASEGTANGHSEFILQTNDPIVAGTTALTFGIHVNASGGNFATLTSGVHTEGERPYATAATRGDTRLSAAPAAPTAPIAVGDNDTRIPTQDENNALVGTSGAPSTANKYVTDADSRLSDTRTPTDTTVTTAKIVNDAVTFAKMADLAADKLIGRDAAGTGDPEAIGVSGGIEFDGAGNIRTGAFTGDVTKEAGGTALTIPADTVTNAMAANMAAATIKGRALGAVTGDPQDLTAAQVAAILGSGGYLDSYGGTDATVEPAVGAIIWQGKITPTNLGTDSAGEPAFGPGYISIAPMTTLNGKSTYSIGPPTFNTAQSASTPSTLGKGIKFYAKGFCKARSATPLNVSYERFALGVLFAPPFTDLTNPTTDFGAVLETTRDDEATVAVIIDDSDNIQSYDNAAVGDASYDDTGHNQTMTGGFWFEIIVETPSMANSDNDNLVTIKITRTDGTVVDVFTAANPTSTATTNTGCILLLVNCNMSITNLVGKVERAA